MAMFLTIKTPSAEKGTGWQVVNQRVVYVKTNGIRKKGLKKIGKKTYYFSKAGVQQTGWHQIGNDYYYFQTINGRRGYMVSSRTVNGIRLKKNGKAKLTAYAKKKLPVLAAYTKLVAQWTRPTMTKLEKLRICYQKILDNRNFFMIFGNTPYLQFHYSPTWEIDYAERFLNRRKGACYEFGAGLAFLANAAGYSNVKAICSGSHGWAEISGKVYDAGFEKADERHSYFGMPYNLSGVDGRPGFAGSRVYVADI